MPFIGTQPDVGGYSVLDALTASATASYTLQKDSTNFAPSSANQLLVSLNGVIQKPGSSFTVSGSTLTFSSALTSSDSIDFIIAMGEPLLVGVPSDATITGSKLASNIGISTTGNIATTGSGTLTSAGLITATSGMTVGNAHITMANGYGINFGATSDGSGTVGHEILDDYEIGTWTPVVKLGTTTQTVGQAQYCVYTKIGRMVHVQGEIANITKSGTGELSVEGLPFANGYQYGGALQMRWGGIDSGGSLTALTGGGVSKTVFQRHDNSGYIGGVTDSHCSSTYHLYQFGIVYMA